MHLALQNAETINRLVEQGEFLLKRFRDEHRKDPTGLERNILPVCAIVNRRAFFVCLIVEDNVKRTRKWKAHATIISQQQSALLRKTVNGVWSLDLEIVTPKFIIFINK
jgi:acetolactate synthase regulatory subunit